MQLQELKQALEQSRSDLHHYQLMLQKRENALEKLHVLKKSVEADLLQMHQLQKSDPKKAEAVKKRIDEETQEITLLKKSVKEIDSELDQLGEEKEETATAIKQELIQRIHEAFPDQVQEYQQSEQKLNELNAKEKRLEHHSAQLQALYSIVSQEKQIKEKMALLDWLFGRHPHAQLAKLIHYSIQKAESIYPEIEEAHLKAFLDRFLRKTKDPHNRSLYQGKFAELSNELSTLLAQQQEELIQTRLEINLLQEKLESWLDKHTK